MTLIQNRLTATISIRIRPESTLAIPIKFTEEDAITDFDLSSFPDGLYTMQIRNLITSEYWIKKLIVQ